MLEDTDLTDFMDNNHPTGKRSKLDAYCQEIIDILTKEVGAGRVLMLAPSAF